MTSSVDFDFLPRRALSLAQGLAADGLTLLEPRFGGVDPQDGDERRFEEELLAERFGGQLVNASGGWHFVGYTSAYLDGVLGDRGVSREDLFDLSRAESVDVAILSIPGARRYTRDFLTDVRSGQHIAKVNEEMARRYSELDVSGDFPPRASSQRLREVVEGHLGRLGFDHVRQERSQGVAWTRRMEGRGWVDVILGNDFARVPASYPLSFTLTFAIRGEGERRQARMLERSVDALIPNLGHYKVAWSNRSQPAQLLAYELIAARVLPLICDWP